MIPAIQLGEGRFIAIARITCVLALSQFSDHDFCTKGCGDFAVIDLCKNTPPKTAIVTTDGFVFLTNFTAETVMSRIQDAVK
jgi:hypothetical protein